MDAQKQLELIVIIQTSTNVINALRDIAKDLESQFTGSVPDEVYEALAEKAVFYEKRRKMARLCHVALVNAHGTNNTNKDGAGPST